VASERFLLRKIHPLGHGHQLLLTLGLAYILLELVKWVWGTESHPIDSPTLLAGSVPLLAGAYPVYRLFICAVALLILGALALLLFKTRLGMIVRAAVSDSDMVSALGFNVGNVFTGVFGVGALLAGIAGVISAPMISVYPGMAADILVDVFIVVVVGGLGSLRGALVASLLLGIFRSFGILFAPEFAMVFSFALMAVVLVWKPLGLFGERQA
jgi:branched-chain amino acid transport system permease protein